MPAGHHTALSWSSISDRSSRMIVPSGSVPNPVPADGQVQFGVEAYDADNRRINDLTYDWYVRPQDGNAEVTQNRDGTSATFRNRIERPDGMHVATGGEATLVVRASLGGVEKSAEIDLNLTAMGTPW